MHNQEVKGNDISNVTGNINFNYYNIPSEPLSKLLIDLVKQVRYLKKELKCTHINNTKLIELLNAQTDRIIEKDTEIRDLRRKLENN